MRSFLTILLLLSSLCSIAQQRSYIDSLAQYIDAPDKPEDTIGFSAMLAHPKHYACVEVANTFFSWKEYSKALHYYKLFFNTYTRDIGFCGGSSDANYKWMLRLNAMRE